MNCENELSSGVDKIQKTPKQTAAETVIRGRREGLGCVWCSECVCARTACASLPVLVAHCEDFLHPVIHGFGEPAELLAFLLPAVTRTKNTVTLTGNIFQSHLML